MFNIMIQVAIHFWDISHTIGYQFVDFSLQLVVNWLKETRYLQSQSQILILSVEPSNV